MIAVEEETSIEAVGEVLAVLRRGLATEVRRATRLQTLSRLSTQIGMGGVAAVLTDAAEEEWAHVARLMERVVELGGSPELELQAAPEAHIDLADPPERSIGIVLALAIEEAGSAIRFYADLCDMTWDGDCDTAELALRALIEETQNEEVLKQMRAVLPSEVLVPEVSSTR